MRLTRLSVAVLLFLVAGWCIEVAAVRHAQAPARSERADAESKRKLLIKSKSLCVAVPTDTVSAEITVKLTTWGKLTLVPRFSDADLTMEIARLDEPLTAYSEFRVESAERGTAFTARVRHRRSGVELWSTSKGGNSQMSLPDGAWAARQIAEEFSAFFDSAVNAGQKRK